jgi:AcrR family transcriptional regulator
MWAAATTMENTDRRTEVLDHARHVIMRDGLSTTSLRRISREGGYTTGVLSYYFADKRELIAACFEWTHHAWLDAVEEELAKATTAEENLCTYVTLAIPRDPERQLEWRLWLEFCNASVGDEELADLLRRADGRWQDITARAFAAWEEAGLVGRSDAIDEPAATLVHLADGVGLWAILSGDWDAARARYVAVLRTLGVPDELADRALHPLPARGGD